jgi:hypothetical protein
VPVDFNRSPCVCTLQSDVPRGKVVPPGVLARPCGRPVMTSPATRELDAKGEAQFLCHDCVEVRLRDADAVGVVVLPHALPAPPEAN